MPVARVIQANTKFHQELLGSKNGINRNFITPDKFVGDTIQLYHNGRRLLYLPTRKEYEITESGGIGTGFDMVNLKWFAPIATSELYADYILF